MSAFVHEHDHIDLLVTYLASGDRDSVAGISTMYEGKSFFQQLDPDYTYESDGYEPLPARPGRISCTQLGKLLLAQNIRSVLTRYETAPQSDIEEYAAALDSYEYRPVDASRMRLAEEYDQAVIVAANSYSYQSCETDDWPETDAARWINRIITNAASKLAHPDTLETYAWRYQR